MAYGKKTESKITPMCGYPEDKLKDVKNAITKKTGEMVDIDWSNIRRIYIDQIAIKKMIYLDGTSSTEIELASSISNEYIKAWRLGLGKFITRDLRKNVNLEKYHYLHYTSSNNNKMIAFIRFVTDDDYESEEEIKELKKYNAISFSFTENKIEKHCVVLKIVPESEINYSIEYALSNKQTVNELNDDYFEVIDKSFLIYENNSSEEDEPILENIEETPENVFNNQESLF